MRLRGGPGCRYPAVGVPAAKITIVRSGGTLTDGGAGRQGGARPGPRRAGHPPRPAADPVPGEPRAAKERPRPSGSSSRGCSWSSPSPDCSSPSPARAHWPASSEGGSRRWACRRTRRWWVSCPTRRPGRGVGCDGALEHLRGDPPGACRPRPQGRRSSRMPWTAARSCSTRAPSARSSPRRSGRGGEGGLRRAARPARPSPSIDLSGWDEAEIAAGYRRLLVAALSGRVNGAAPRGAGSGLRPPPRRGGAACGRTRVRYARVSPTKTEPEGWAPA